jgi:ABC-type uncharacterized transport system substrate-binding protein
MPGQAAAHADVPPFRPSRCYGRAMPHLHRLFCAVLAALGLFAAEAQAHPHVWVTMKSEVVYADGVATGVRHAWTFDDMFSTYATQGLESKEKGKFTRAELAPLAQVNIESLKDFDYFTVARINGKKADLKPPVDYYLEFTDGLLTLHFTLPLATSAKAQSLDLEMYDPTWFVDFSFAEKEPVRLAGAPADCKLAVLRPGEGGQAKPQGQPGEAFFNNLGPSSNYGAKFANKIAVNCP